MINKQSYQITGMRQDNLVGTGASTKFAHEIMNLRLNTIGDYTTAAWTTEKGTKQLEVTAMTNTVTKTSNYQWLTDLDLAIEDFRPIGQANINDEWVLFGKIEDTSHADYDVILNLRYEVREGVENLYGRILYKGNLNFQEDHPIETLTFYENELIQKVYWTDGINQPRMINIKGAEGISDGFSSGTRTQFDFVQEVALNEQVTISKRRSGTGLFPPGTVKYAITYYKQYGPETNIVYDSPLHYPTLGDRACSPDELSGDSFEITVDNVDNSHGFDYIRLYSIVRTTENAIPIVRIVEDKHIDNTTSSVTFIDTNTTGNIIDPSVLNYIGGNVISVETFDQKDNTLFLGNITLNNKSVTSIIKEHESDFTDSWSSMQFILNESITQPYLKLVPIYYNENTSNFDEPRSGNYYKYTSQLNDNKFHYTYNITNHAFYTYKANSFNLKNFKKGEYYRFGIQFQDDTGKWSEVVRLGDETTKEYLNKECDVAPIVVNEKLYALPILKYILPTSIVEDLVDNHYRKARLVCCYTTNSDRSFIAQGVVNQAVYNLKEAGNLNDPNNAGSPYAMSSWFFRPFKSGDIGAESPDDSYVISKEEIQSINNYKLLPLPPKYNENDSTYKTHENYWTLNSPEVEFDESIRTLDSRAFNTKLIGGFNITSRASSVYVDATSPFINHLNERGSGLTDKTNVNQLSSCNSHDFDYCKWNDLDVFYMHAGGGSAIRNYPIIPFQRKTSLTNYLKDIKNWKVTDKSNDNKINITQGSAINSKIWANLCYTLNSNFNSEVKYKLSEQPELQFFDSNEVLPTMINNKVYYGNVNTIAPIETDYILEFPIQNPLESSNSNPVIELNGFYTLDKFDGVDRTNKYHYVEATSGPYDNTLFSTDPVTITYKSTPHIVLYGKATANDTGDTNDFYLAEIYRSVGDEQKFGGLNNRHNIYLPCGPAVQLNPFGTTLYGYEGDHYVMRYDCLKTYPFSTEDTNQIVDILSFMCESRINLDGRYDKNRGLVDNTIVMPTNFNLINKSYTQSNNFFAYTELFDDKIAVEVDNFPNQITWTKEKVSGEDVDAWTNITLVSKADADGTVGKITKIINVNDKLLLFQDHALAQIGFNENTAISTENGIPLELAKTGKYTGLNYITREIGCQNKWSISQSKNGLFWIDDSRQELMRYGEGLQSLSSMSGFDAFFIKELPKNFTAWNPLDFNNFVSYYDKLSNDIYYINNHYCLAWNEQSQSFTSFYNYQKVPYMMNLGTHSVMCCEGLHAARENTQYSTFFDQIKPYYMTIVCDGITDKGSAFSADKVFNNIEYRADIFNIDGQQSTNINYSKSVFDQKEVWNGYQKAVAPLDGIRKFNTWRVQLPRDQVQGTRNRIRSPFCYISLVQNNSTTQQTDRMILHDLAVYFDMQ